MLRTMKDVLGGIAVLAITATASAQPTVDGAAIAAFADRPLTITGAGFGEAARTSALVLASGPDTRRIPSTAGEITEWTDRKIVVRLHGGARSGRFRIETTDGTSREVRLEAYRYDWFDIPPTAGTNALPLAIARAADGTLWINQEFHLDLQRFDPGTLRVSAIPIPRPAMPGPFALSLPGIDTRTQISGAGEDVIVDPGGRVWFTQGGGYLYGGKHPNHSRVVRYDPNAPERDRFRVYNVPGDWNQVIGIAWDARRGRIWFAEGGLDRGRKIVSFDPERVPADNTFDFSRPLDDQLCPRGGPYDNCFRVHELPEGSRQPAHLALDRDGRIWYTAFWGNRIGRLDPETGAVIEYPLPKALGTSQPAATLGSGPWQIAVAPDGDIVFNTHFAATIGRIETDRAGDRACLALDATGRNPCIREIVDTGIDLSHDFLHSIAFAADGRLWFTEHGPQEGPTAASLGFVTPDWREIVRLPPLAGFSGDGNAAATGLAIDPGTGDVWFCEFWRRRIGRLRRLD
jgi:streptogramin lyase